METEELNFLLQSGIVLCKLAVKIVPGTDIQTDKLQVIIIIIMIKIIIIIFIIIYNRIIAGWQLDDEEEKHFLVSCSCSKLWRTG